MDRRAFLKFFGAGVAGAAAAALVPDALQAFDAKRRYFLPPPSGWTGKGLDHRISMRWVKEYNIAHDRMPQRFNVLYGVASIQPDIAFRYDNNTFETWDQMNKRLVDESVKALADRIDAEGLRLYEDFLKDGVGGIITPAQLVLT